MAAIATSLIAGAASAPAATTTLHATALQTIGQQTDPSSPTAAVTAGGVGYIVANDGDHGRELYRVDGTGTPSLVKDIEPGSDGSDPQNLTAVAGDIYFTVYDDAHGRELWRSDGTAAGTTLVKDIAPGSVNSSPYDLVASGGKLYFSADDGTDGSELWTSDGTDAGTHVVKDINSGSGDSDIDGIAPFDGGVAFSAYDGTDAELWTSDGTPAGTTKVDVVTGAQSSYPYGFTAIGSELYFAADDGTGDDELYKSDGTTASRVKDINPAGANLDGLTAVGSTLFFLADDGVHGRELWSSDGTTAGTALVKDINGTSSDSGLGTLTAFGGKLYFTADDGVAGNELYRSDGTLAGTAIVKDINANGTNSSYPSRLTVVGSHLDFTADAGNGAGTQLWTTDGTAAGTTVIPGSFGNFQYLSAIGNLLYFSADDDVHGREPGISDGTAAGTVLHDLNVTGLSNPSTAVALGDLRLFTAQTDNGRRVFVTDGTAAGTHALAVDGIADTRDIAIMGGKAYFFGQDGNGDAALFATDGTDAGTTEVTNQAPGDDGADLTAVGNQLFFQGHVGYHNDEPFVSDGTAAGTRQLGELWTSGSSHDRAFTALGSKVVFVAYDGSGWAAWVSDGTPAGTTKLSTAAAYGGSVTAFGGRVYFSAGDGTYGQELWSTDGTPAGTSRVTDLNPGTADASPQDLTVAGGRLYFDADGGSGNRLFAYDGTGAPTAVTSSAAGSSLTAFDGGLLFADQASSELNVTDGTVSGTHGLGATVADGARMQVVGTTAYFTGRDDEHGIELWSTDGTAAGTRLGADLAAGPVSSHAVPLAETGGDVLAIADQPGTGTVLTRLHETTTDDGGAQSGGGGTTTTTTTGTRTTPAPAPAPRPAPAKGRAKPRSLSLTASTSAGRRLPFRIVVSGRLKPATACTGTVTITARRGDVTVVSVRVKLRSDCSYRATLTKNTKKHLAAHGGRLSIVARFSGNASLLPARSATRTTRYGA